MNIPKISVIVPIYNAEKFISKCIESVLNQTFTEFELILVNDGSQDNSGNIIDEYAINDPRIKVFHNSNKGTSITRSFGVKQALGIYLFFLDSDDFLDPKTLEKLYNSLTTNNYDIIIGNFTLVRSKKEYKKYQSLPFGTEKHQLFCALLTSKVLGSLCGRLIKKTLFSGLIMIDELKVGEDCIVMYQLFSKTKNIGILNENLYYYVQHSESTMHRQPSSSLKSRIVYCTWVLSFVDTMFGKSQDEALINSKAYFAIEQYYSLLLNGGIPEDDPIFTKKIYDFYYCNKSARNQFPFWKILLLKFTKMNYSLGAIYRSIIVKSLKLLEFIR